MNTIRFICEDGSFIEWDDSIKPVEGQEPNPQYNTVTKDKDIVIEHYED